jgi:xanthine dehydrogenase molybdopterin-binding subunit B
MARTSKRQNNDDAISLLSPHTDLPLLYPSFHFFLRWPALREVGRICRTNQPSHTAFRGFGAPQGMAIVETALEHLSSVSGFPAHRLRATNLYHLGDQTHFRQVIDEWNVSDALEQVMVTGEVERRQAEIDVFNRENKWIKRGLAVIPTKYGLNYTAKFMNQGGALVNIYTDGTVLVSHGGIEMGQGLHTKMIQVTARALNIPHQFIHIAGEKQHKYYLPPSLPINLTLSSHIIRYNPQEQTRVKSLTPSPRQAPWVQICTAWRS